MEFCFIEQVQYLVMCDSHISESCPMDFTNYCPVDSLRIESAAKLPVEKSQRNHTTWFTRKAKGSSSHNKRLSQGSSDQFRERSNSNGTNEVAYLHHFTDSYKKCVESRSNEDYCVSKCNTRSLEKASRYVSQEELNALKGCVMRRRAVFSPSPASSPVHSFVHKKQSSQPSPSFTNSLPIRGRQLLKDDEASHVRQSSLEYDHLKDFDPVVDNSKMADSVSVQFRLQGCAESNKFGARQDSLGLKHGTVIKKTFLHHSIPERLDCCAHLGSNGHGFYQLSHHNSFDLQSLQETGRCCCNACNWPQNDLSTEAITNEPVTENKPLNALPPFIGKSSHVQLLHSPFHSKYNSPVLSRHQVYPCEGSMKTCDAGSNYSLYSQTTTVSSLTDRQHCSYSKGVDGNLFKDRTEVITYLFLT